MELRSPAGTCYQVGKPIGETESFRLYECADPEGRQCILKIAATAENNPLLDREAFVLRLMREEASRLEAEYVIEAGEDKALNYHFCFPGIVESFIFAEQGNRRVNVLSFFNIANELSELVPVSHILTRDRVRVDPKTSAWMLGKLLKLLVFTQDQGIAINNLAGDNILVNREQHFVAVFDWTAAVISDGCLPGVLVREEIKQATKAIINVLGGNPETHEIPPDSQLEDGGYAKLLDQLAGGVYDDAPDAHSAFYNLVRAVWPKRGFHPFTAYPVD
jgi:hypothetical protein